MVNDSLGHSVGDALLCAIADIFRKQVRDTDTVARFGGDEFVVLLDNLTEYNEAVPKAKKLLDAFAKPNTLGEHLVVSTASIGLVTNEIMYDNADDIIRDADVALYQAKDNGRAQVVVFDSEMHKAAIDRLTLEEDLRIAVVTGEFELVYQPIVELDTGDMTGFEALIRWSHPEHGVISPLDFIPIAEETGLIKQIGSWILRQAAKQAIEWNKTLGLDRMISINVNVSKRQLLDNAFLEETTRCKNDYDLRPGEIQLEITESIIADDRSDIAPLLKQLRDSGYPIVMDDFGTGVSSLGSLHNFPIDVLKIDKAFIDVLDQDRSLLAVVSSITNLADNLGIKTVAEGIEKLDIVGALQSINCTWGQGYFFAKPMSVADVEVYVKNEQEKRGPRAA